MKKTNTKRMVLLAMLAATAYMVVCLIRIPAVLFLKYEPKDVVITIGGFLLGPMASFIVSLLVSLLEMVTISETGPIGALMNLLSTCAFACTAAFVYKKRHTIDGAILGLLLGTVTMVATMLLWNWLITPLYMGPWEARHATRAQVVTMLLPIFLPFNALKAGLNSALILGLYKPVVGALRRTGLIAAKPQKSGTAKIGIYLFSAALLISCILLLLVFQGKL